MIVTSIVSLVVPLSVGLAMMSYYTYHLVNNYLYTPVTPIIFKPYVIAEITMDDDGECTDDEINYRLIL
jgi:hypothetical protein